MDSLITFQAGKKARADEVNSNFSKVSQAINNLEEDVSSNATAIDNLDRDKANINGSTSQEFDVKAPTGTIAGTKAINQQYLMNSISNTVDIISGFTIVRDEQGNPNTTIIVSAGSCYDSTHSVLLKTTQDYTATYSGTQAATHRYDVYVMYDSDTPEDDILISDSGVNPITENYKGRLIGYYLTDEDANISTVIFYGTSASTPSIITSFQSTINGSGYNIYSNGFCEQWGYYEIDSGSGWFEIDLLVPYKDKNYSIIATKTSTDSLVPSGDSPAANYFSGAIIIDNTKFQTNLWYNATRSYALVCRWCAFGYIS